ncbi:MAG: DNA-3-methyladenine glycosylase family protein [Gemmatimonadales bacterium]
MTGLVRRLTAPALRAGAIDLAGRDVELARIHARLGHPPLWGRPTGFTTLFRIILEQQVSLAGARTLFRRIEAHLGRVTTHTVHAAGVDGLRALGLTRQKAAYTHGLAHRILEGALDLRGVARAPDETGRQLLLAVPGLGPWSVDIYFLMALKRPDVWPRGDLALALALKDVKGLRVVPSHDEQHAITAAWSPWRSVGARLLWMHYLHARRMERAKPGRA